ncbi:hypothetical protein RJ639_006728 [Escallonia herrerae]|uniref:t-SNARE coiled-coil homology domain-containing protein n=1 Tax=Escallonia herrerae TaxID=1293975 RepID=A0AA88VWK7_9ASTE|nr:hypothetical protein RJ639_006728 [Escallonia herrerae]
MQRLRSQFRIQQHLCQDSFEIPRGQHRGGDIEMGQRSGELGLDNFFKQVARMISVIGFSALVVQEIDKQYDKLNKLLKKLQVSLSPPSQKKKKNTNLIIISLIVNQEMCQSVAGKATDRKSIKQRMEKDVDEVGKIARFIKLKIEELDRDNMANRQKPGCGKGTAVDRSRTATTVRLSFLQEIIRQIPWSSIARVGSRTLLFLTHLLLKAVTLNCTTDSWIWLSKKFDCRALRKKFKDKMSEFQTLRESIHQEHRQLVERRVFTVTGTRVAEETIDRMIGTGDSEQIFQKAIREQGRGQIMDTLAEIQERQDAVREVERKLLELQQIFLDMAVPVDAQGDMLDNIETHVSNAVDHVQDGNNALQKAKTLQRNSRKWMCIAILILLIIVVVVVVGVLKPWNSNKGT